MKTIGISFIGAGYMAEEHVRAFSGIPGVSLRGITSRSLDKAKSLQVKYGIERVCISIDDLYNSTYSDIVVVCVPILSVALVCGEVFKYPWVSLIEKPVGYDLNQAVQVMSLAERYKHVAYIALNRRHYSSTLSVLDQVSKVDGVRLVNVYDQESPVEALKAGQDPLVVKNWMYANSIHLIDYFNIFCRGELLSVEPVIRWNPENPFLNMAKLNYSSGDIGIYQAVWNAPGPWAVQVVTHNKRWELKPLEQGYFQLNNSRVLEAIAQSSSDIEFKPGLRLQAENLLRAIKGENNSLPTLAQGMKTMRLIKMLYES